MLEAVPCEGTARVLRSTRPPLGAPLADLSTRAALARTGNVPMLIQRAPRGRVVVPAGRSPGVARGAWLQARPQAPHPAPP